MSHTVINTLAKGERERKSDRKRERAGEEKGQREVEHNNF